MDLNKNKRTRGKRRRTAILYKEAIRIQRADEGMPIVSV